MPPTPPDNTRNGGFANRSDGRAAEAPTGDYYLVAIAVDEYDNQDLNLANPVKDAQAIVDLLTTDYGGLRDGNAVGFTLAKTKCFFKKEDTSVNSVVKYLKKLATSDDFKNESALLIYFAGHGFEEGGEINLCLPEFDQDLPSTYLTLNSLYKMFNDVAKCRDLLIVLDCCYAGNAANGYGQKTAGTFCRKVLMSAGNDQKASDGRPSEGSPFANALLRSLRLNAQPTTSVASLFASIKNQMALSMAVRNPGQNMAVQEPLLDGLPGTDSGAGQFWFQRWERHLPPDLLRRSLMEHFNFNPQRSTAADYEVERRFSVINCTGKGANEQKILARFFFNYLLEQRAAETPLGVGVAPFRVLPLPVQTFSNIWADLQNALKISADPANVNQPEMVNHLLKWMTDAAGNDAAPVLIFWLHLAESTPKAIESTSLFCSDLLLKLNQAAQNPDPTFSASEVQLLQSARLFAFISEDREGRYPLAEPAWFGPVAPFSNVLIFDPIEPVKKGTVRDWLAKPENRLQMQHPDFEALDVAKLLKKENCSLEEFVEFLIEEIKYPDQVTQRFLTQLYQLENPKMF